MKTLLSITLLLSMFILPKAVAQDIMGKATYKSQRKMEIELDSTHMNDEMRQQVMAMLKKQTEREYELEFNQNESIYKEAESLDAPSTGAMGGMQFQVMEVGGSDILYKNVVENRYVNQNESFSKLFLIEDELEQPEWKLEKETKNIGEYTCFKATFTRMDQVFSSIRTSDSEEKEMEEPGEVERTITAWYTPQIPVKHGPGEYSGLPGLILEVSDGQETILCSKIVLNPKGGVSIDAPTKGKKLSQAEFDVIMDKKMKEMEEQFESRRGGRDNGADIEIRIGG